MSYKPLFTYHQKSNNHWYVMDIPCNCYGHGNTEQEAVDHAVSRGINPDDITINGVL